MIKIFSAGIALTFLLSACNSDGQQNEPTTPDTVNTSSETPVVDNDVTPETKVPVTEIKYWKDDASALKAFNAEVKGKIVDGATWKDSKGTNLLLLTAEDAVATFNEEYGGDVQTAYIHGYHFVENGNGLQELWKTQDFIKDCEFDVILYYMEGAFEITDLDDNGVAESAYMYRVDCVSDVSPQTTKLILHEGTTKMALRGHAEVDLGGDFGLIGGDKEADDALKAAPDTFMMYANRKWDQFKKQ